MKKILKNINPILQFANMKLFAKMYLANVLINIFLIIIFLVLSTRGLNAQSGACDGAVPVFVVDLSSDPSAVWTQAGVDRDGSCCSYNNPPNSCVKFILTLHSSARSIIFSVTDGALPQNLEWQLMNTVGDYCDTTKYPADVPVCMSGQGPHTIIFCKPGGNGNTYTITSVPANAATINSSFNGCGYLLDAGAEWNSYFWNTGDTTQTIAAQDSGWYWVDASSINCSSKRDSIYVAYNPPISLGNDTSICFGQTVTLSPGNNFAFYEWSNGVSGAMASSITVGGGTYSVTVTDSSACTSSASIRIIEETNLFVNITGTNVKCIGEQNGSVNITISGGIAPYLYNWSNGFTTEDISSLTTGVYSVIVTDNIGCSATESVTIYEPSTFDVSALISDISCFEGNDGAIDITVSGGTSPYSYTWSNGAITADINNLIAGIFTVTIYDSNMCNVTYQAEVEKPSIFLSAYAIGNNVSCKGGADGYINLSVSGGTSPYIFFWNNSETSQNIYNVQSGTYSVTVTDSNGCITTSSTEVYEPENDIQMDVVVKDANCLGNLDGAIDISVFGGTPYFSFYWNIGQISEDIDGIGAGTYNVTITDINNCSTSSTVFVNEPNGLIINESHIDISCFGGNDGSILTNPSGGTLPYSYIWNTGETTASLSNLYSGNYNVTLTDSSFCENRSVILLTQPSAILAVLLPYNVKCKGNNDGSINLNVSGGVFPYSFIWSNGALTEDISNLTVGSYSVTITDANGCSATASTSISEPLNNLSASIVVTNLSCYNSSNGSLNLSVSGGTSGYTYLWSNGLTNEDITSLQAGNYSVTITDTNLCTAIASATLTEPSEIIITSSQTNSTCGSATGTADVAISGGLSPYTYLWSNNSTSSSLTNLSAGAYTISVTDANSCLNTKTLNILDTNAPSITVLSSSNVTCYGAANGSASISASGGITPYSYQWSSGGATTSVTGLAGGTYNVSVIDNNGCISNSSIVISEPSQITKFLIARNVNCYGGSDGAINLIASGGTLPYSYLWSSGQTFEDLNNILSGVYSVTITDANSCQATSSVTVTQPAAALVTSLSVTNVKCFGASNGSINLTVLGGTQPYSYLWNSGQNSEDLNNIPASAYTATVTDANLCIKTASVTITEPAVLAVSSITGSNVSCSGGTNGSIDLEVIGGTPNYSYNWNFSQITQDLTNISAGVYEVTISDTKSCTVSSAITISEPASALTATISKTNVKCNGGNSGAVNLTVSGGTPPYIYLWNTGQATQDLSNIAAGVYTVTVTDTKFCNFVASTTITQPTVLTASIIGSAVSCFGGSDGEANLTVSGGTPLYSYQWNVGHITEDISNLFAGVYVVTITDAKLCKVTSSVTITQQLAITTSSTKVNVNCKNGNNGSIDLTVSGGIAPYTYLWNTGQNTQDISSLIDDIYEVTITDANSCTAYSSIIISEPVDILSVSINSTNLKCRNGADGSAECVAIGGTAPYTYLWSNGATTIGVTGLAAGTISVTVTDVNNCTATSSVTVSQPATVLALSSVLTNLNCNNIATGSINLTTSGGLSPYTYVWSNGSMTEDISILQAGNYYVTVTDANSCIKTTSATLTEPSAFSVTESITNTNCGSSVGSASITVTGATSPYTYLWSNGSITNSISNVASGAYTVTITDNNLCTEIETININDIGGPTISISFASDVKCNGDGNGKAVVYVSSGLGPFTYLWSAGSTTTTQQNLSGGTYTVSVTDINGCMSTESVSIEEPDALTTTVYAPNICDASSKGFIDLSVYGGVVNYSYLWSNAETSQDILDLNAGIYTVTITDVNSCTLVESVTISIPAVTLTPTVVQTNVKCKSGTDGSIDLSVAGGSPAYTYLWNTGLTSQDITGLLAGIYEVTVTDDISCKATASVTLTEPLPLISSISKTNVDCFSASTGAINLTVQGGTAGYTYLWSNVQTTEDISNLIANSYTVTITDANACKLVSSTVITEPTAITSSITGTNVKCFGANGGAANLTVSGGSPVYTYLWSNASTTEDLNNVIAGNYSVTIIDSKACQNVANVTITQPTQLTVNITKTDVNCYGGSDGNVNITASGGTPNYSYLWNFGQISEDLNNVQSNTYQVTVTDANLCTTSGSIFVNQPASALNASISKTNVSCFGLSNGSINLSVSGGTPNYFYAWSHGFSTEDVNNLASANYTVTVSDNNGCTTTVTTTITQPTAISSTSSITNVKCNGGATGSINLTPSGGTPQYTYLWNNGQTSEDASSLAAGNYSVIITDANLCTGTSSYTITQPTQLSASITGTNLNCYGQYNGQVDLTVSGGTPIYTYLWNDGTTTQDLDNISGGSYNVTVTDVNQCATYNSITITEPPLLTSTAIISNVKCFGQATGNINLIVSGGTPNYTYTWSNGATIEDLTNIVAGNYSVIITDDNSCQSIYSTTITQPAAALATSFTKTNVSCYNGTNGAIDLTVTGGIVTYSYLWSNGSVTQDLTNKTAGIFGVTVTDANNCQTTAIVTITQPDSLYTTHTSVDVSCFSGLTGSVNITTHGGTPAYSYVWNSLQITEDLSNIAAGTYTLILTDFNNCKAYDTIAISQPVAALTTSYTSQNVLCFGGNNASIDLEVTGGTSPYTYLWNYGQTTQDLSNLASGIYDGTVTDTLGCKSYRSVTITQPTVLTSSIVKSNVNCYNELNGNADLSVSGGTSPYSYIWNSGQTTQDLTNVGFGNYSVTVTDANLCTIVSSVTITQPDTLYASSTVDNVACFGNSTGNIYLDVFGGTPSYTFNWSSGQSIEDLQNIPSGVYSLTITDSKLCKTYNTVTVTQPNAALTNTYTSQNVACNGGNTGFIDLSVAGGTSPYTYYWSNGQITQDLLNIIYGTYSVTITDSLFCKSYRTVIITQPLVLTSSIVNTNVNCYNELNGNADLSVSGGTSPYLYIWNSGQTTQDLTNVGFGNYSVTVTDTLGCNSYSTITITQPDTLFATSTVNNVACFGNSTGNIYLDVFGGTPPYIFNWSSGQIVEDLQNIPSGVYSLTITDTKLCKTYNTVTVTQPIAALSNSYTSQNVLCNGGNSGSIDLSVAGGTSPYTYYWSNGLTTQDLTNIVAGNYSVTVTDSKSCKSFNNTMIIEPSAISSSIIVTNVKCNGNSDGATNLSVSGGTSPYTYLWSNSQTSEDLANILAGIYSVTITDSNLCQNVASTTVTQPNILTSTYSVVNVGCKGDSTASVNLTVTGGTPIYAYLWNFGQITEDVSGIPAGIYSVTVTDTKNCKAYSNLTITEPASDLTTMIAKTDVKCFGGNSGIADLTSNGGTTPYTYAWNFGQTSQDLNNITAGNYCVTVTDSKNCTSSSCVTISQPTAISATFIEAKVKCKGNSTGGLNLTPTGGVPPYTFVWSNGTTTEDITNVQAGIFTVTITDSYLCSFAKSSAVTEPALPLSAVSTVSNVSCYNGNDGNINITVSGGTPSYSYTWNNGQSSEDISNLQQGVYEVTITDINLCTTSNSVTVTQPTELLLTTTQTNSTCGVADGTASVTATGGTIPYSYLWSNGINTSALVNIPSGLYSVTVTDNKSCNKSASIAVNDEGAPSCNIVSTTDVTCNGNANGAATVLAVGGTGAYTFAWSQGASTTTATGLNGGIYYVSVTDENNCLSTSSVTINEPAVLLGNISTVSVKCKGNSTGSANLTVSGGTPSYLYQWSNGTNTEDISGLAASQYNVTITDSHNCKAYSSVTVTEPAFPVTLSLTKSNVSCNGGSNGSIDLSVFGGTPGYTYIWNFGQSSQDLTGIIAGLYEVTVSDINLCKSTTSGFVSEPLPIQIQASITNSTCNGQSNGAVNISVSGGTSPYSYSWSNGAISEDISNIFGGVYSVTITDSNNCIKISSYTVTEPTGLLYSTLATDVKCFGGNTGSIALSVSGGTLPYSYVWSNGETSEDISVLLAGTYTVTIKDSKLCTSIVSTTVSQPAMALATSSTQTNVLCYDGNNGFVSATVVGGTSPYSYMWNYGQTTSSISALVAGLYELTITDKNGCTDFLSTTITEPDEIILSPGQTGSTCGMSNGSASISATGGTSPYLYLWNTTSTSTTISNLSAGAYSVEVTDANNCKSSITINVSDAGSPSVTFTYNNVSCFGLSNGNIDMNVSGGTTPYTYLWNNNDFTEDLTNISGGNYSITITDNNGCKSTKSVTVEEPALLTISDTSKNVTCNGFANGFINVSVVGGTQAYNYNWSNSAVTQDINNISGGIYSLTVTDLNNCTATLNKTISEPTQALSFSLNTNNVKCYNGNDGNINLTVSGGTSGYAYKWNLGQTSEDLNGLIAGNYQVTVTDANGCLLTADTNITQPTILTASVNSTDVKCKNGNDGLIDLSISDGVSPYSYFWANGQTWQDIDTLISGIYSVTITDGNQCKAYATATISQPAASLSFTYNSTNIKCYGDSTGLIDMSVAGGTPAYSYIWNNGTTSQDISNLVAGNYLLTITDNNGCKLNSGNIAITQPSNALSTSYSSVDVLCYSESNASINLSVSGGTAGYSYLWSSGQTTQDLSNIYAGNYSVTVSDANSCRSVQNITITQPTALNAFVVKGDVSCFGYNDGTVDLTVTGGTNPYLYSWNYGQSSQDLSSVSSGTYIVTVTDNHNCRINAYAIVTEPALLTAVITPVNVLCKGASTGIAELVVSGGTVNYSYNWSNGEVTEDLTNVYAGNYAVTITDSKNCFITATVNIQEPSTALTSSSIVANVICNGQSNGAINLTINGGTGTYNYNWNYGQTTQDLDNLTAGNYEVTVTDQNSCILIDSIIISQPNPIILTPVKTNSTCGMSNGSASITVSGGSVPYFYAWSNGSQSQSISSLSAGTYSVTVTDSKGCLKFIYINVNDYGAPVSSISNYNNTSCFGYSDGSATVSAIGGIGTYNYLWTNGQTNATATALSAGIYSVSVSDQNGCLSSSTIEIEQPEVLSLQFDPVYVSCNGGTNGAINLTVSGGTSPYSYLWNYGQTVQDLFNLSSGNYEVTVTDSKLCKATDNINITQPNQVVNVTTSKTNVSCNGGNNGAINLTITGGTPPYSYLWNNGFTNEDISGLTAGSYEVTVTDSKGCNTVKSININQPNAILVTSVVTNVSCKYGNNAAVDITVSGGTSPYYYLWSNGVMSRNVSNLIAGNYSLTLADNLGCENISNYTITEPSILVAYINSSPVSCFGENNGEAAVIVSGGTAPYSYLWNNFSTSEDIQDLTVGNYSVTVTDAKACDTTLSVNINQPSSQIIASINSVNVSCYGGSDGFIDLSVSGGTPGYIYTWNYGQTSQDLSNLNARTYQVTITDANGCDTSLSQIITQPSQISLTPIATYSACNDSTGMATVSVSGGVSPYSYYWSTGSFLDSLIDIPSDAYSVSVTDMNGCIKTITVNVNDLGAPDLTLTHTNVTCFGMADGSIDLTLSGSINLPMSYNWSSGSTTEDLSNLSGGQYFVTVSDINNCKAFDYDKVNEFDLIRTSVSGTNVSCYHIFDGSINLTVTGGTGPGSYTYIWSNFATSEDQSNIAAGLYFVTITDANGCDVVDSINIVQPADSIEASFVSTNVSCYGYSDALINLTVSGGSPNYSYLWNLGQTTEDISNISTGLHEVTITDSKGCKIVRQIIVSQPNQLSLTFATINVSCKGGSDASIDLSVSGGTAPYSYLWNYGQTIEDLDSLDYGIYSVVIKDSLLCSTFANITITEPIKPMLLQISGSDVLCNGQSNGSAYVVSSGGTAPYTYLWSTGSTNSSISNISADTYTVTATDIKGCMFENSITIIQPAPFSVKTDFNNVKCNGFQDANIDISVTGGTQPYYYEWSPGNITQDLLNIGSGNYAVTITDANNCSTVNVTTITQPTELQMTNSITNVTCYGDSNGAVEINVSGGVSGYTYKWNYGNTTQNVTNLYSGLYEVTATDLNGCTIIKNMNVTESPQISVAPTIENVNCYGENSGQIQLNVTGGTPNYNFSWSNGSVSNILPNITAGQYSISITDNNNCPFDSTIIISQPDSLIASVVASMEADIGSCNGYLTISANGGTPSYSYLWSPNGYTGTTSNSLCPTIYIITVTDINGCKDTVSFNMKQKPPFPQADFDPPESGCPPHTVDFINKSLFATYYLWDFGDGTTDTIENPSHEYLQSGVYIVKLTVSDIYQNDESDKETVTVYEKPSVAFDVAPKTVTMFEEPIHCYNWTYGGATYLWNFGDGVSSNEVEPIHNYSEEGTYDIFLEAWSENACFDSLTIKDAVTVVTSCIMVFPDAFIPTKEGALGGNWQNETFYSNRIFHPVQRKVSEYKLEIYDRWGQLLFISEDINVGWDGYFNGKLCQQDVYVFKARWTCEDGTQQVKAGDVTLYH